MRHVFIRINAPKLGTTGLIRTIAIGLVYSNFALRPQKLHSLLKEYCCGIQLLQRLPHKLVHVLKLMCDGSG